MVDLGYSATMGARPLRRTIQDQIEDGIAEFYLEHPQVRQLKAQLEDSDKIIVTSAESPAPSSEANTTEEESSETNE